MTAKTLVPARKGGDIQLRFSGLIWGLHGTGKTTLAATAPGGKLWLTFGDSEHASVAHRTHDVETMDFSSIAPGEIFKHGMGMDPFGLDAFLYESKHIKTVVCDSLTAIEYAALQHSVSLGIGASQKLTPTMAEPGRSAYGGRNQFLIGVMKSLLTVTNKHRCHIIFTAHENDPVTKQAGGKETVDVIGMNLTAKVTNHVSAALSEIWNLRQEPSSKRNRIVTTRVSGSRRPMKTRMFSQKGESSFVWSYDPDLPDDAKGQMTIAQYWNEFQKRGYKRIPVPSNRPGGDKVDNEVTVLGPHSGT